MMYKQIHTVLLTVAFSSYALPSALDSVSENDLSHAMTEINAIAMLLMACFVCSGLYMVGSSILGYMKSSDNMPGAEKGPMKYLGGVIIGSLTIVIPVLIAVMHNTILTSSPDQEFALNGFSINEQIALLADPIEKTGLRRYLPASSVFTIYGILFLIGLYAVFKALRTCFIAIVYGGDTYGQGMQFKFGIVLAQMVFGLALMFVDQSHCLFWSTWGQSQMCY